MNKIYEKEINSDDIVGEGFTPFHLHKENKSFCSGTYIHEQDLINIFAIDSKSKGDMKAFINHLVEKFNTNNVQFYCVMGVDLFKKLKGFKQAMVIDPHFNEEVLCLRGIWRND